MSIHTQQKTLFQKFFLNKRVLSYTLALVASVTLAYVLHITRVQKIVVTGSQSLSGLQNVENRSLLLLSVNHMQQELMHDNPNLQTVRVAKMYPHTLSISVREMAPVATVRLKDGSVEISQNGTVLQKHKKFETVNLPVITFGEPLYFSQIGIGESIDQKEIHTALVLMSEIAVVGNAITTIDIADADMIVLQTETYSVIASSEVDSQIQTARFAFTFGEMRRRKTDFQSLDVRFEKPIIKLKK